MKDNRTSPVSKLIPPPVNGDFVQEGYFLALPLGFPGVSRPLPAEQCRLKRVLSARKKQGIFSFSRGPEPRIFRTLPWGEFGYTASFRAPDGIKEIEALCTFRPSDFEFLLFAGTEDGVTSKLFGTYGFSMGPGIQEWHVHNHPARKITEFPGEKILDLRCSPDAKMLAVLLESRLVFYSIKKKKFTLRSETKLPRCYPRFLACDNETYLLHEAGGIARVDWQGGEVLPIITPNLPYPAALVLACESKSDILLAFEDGTICDLSLDGGLKTRGRIPLLPVAGMVRLPDGRILATAGKDICHLFELASTSSGDDWARDLGVAVSTLTTRRYGLQLGEMVCGSSGEVFLAEDDRGGHLWIYFPAASNI